MITGIHHTGLVVPDLDAAIAFFATRGAFAPAARYRLDDSPSHRAALEIDDAGAEVALLRGTLGCLELFRFDAPVPQADPRHVYSSGIRHICLQAEISDDLHRDMRSAGASGHAPPAGLGTGNSYVYLRDPWGDLLELEGVPWDPGVTRPWYAHTAIVTPDIDRLTGFYAMLTGAPIVRRGTFGPNAKFDHVAGLKDIRFHGAWLRLANAEIEFWQYLEPASAAVTARRANEPGWNHICLETTDIRADHARLSAAGVALNGPPIMGERWSILFGRDPDGNLFELLQPNAADGLDIAAMLGDVEARKVIAARDVYRAGSATKSSGAG